MKKFIVIEMFGGVQYAAIVTDEEGNNKVFDTRNAAEEEANNCQEGIVVEC